MSYGLADIIAQVGKSSGLLDTDTSKIEANLSDAAALSMNTSAVLRQAASDSAIVELTKQSADLSTQTARQKIGLDFGVDRNAQNQVYSTLSAIESREADKQLAAKAEIDRKESISLLDDPIGYITARLTINQDIRKYNAAESNRADAFKRIADLNTAADVSSRAQSLYANTVTQASAEAAARLAAVAATEKANTAEIQSKLYNNAGLTAVLQADAQKLSFLFQTKNAQNADAQLALSQKNNDRLEEEWQFRKAIKLKEDKYDSSILDAITLGRGARGLPPLSGVKGDTVLQMIKSKAPGAEEFIDDWKAGEKAQINGTGTVQLAGTPAEMIGRIQNRQAILVSPSQELVKDKLNDAFTFVTASKTFDPKDVVGNMHKLNDATMTILNHDAAEVRPGDAKNLFSIPPINQIVKTSEAAAATPVYQKILKPLMDSGVNMDDPNNVIAAIINGIRSEKLTYGEALSTTTLYQVGSAANLANRALPKFGIPNQPQFYRYNVKLHNLASDFGFDSTVDLTKPDQFGRFLNKQLSNLATVPGGVNELPLK